MEHVLKRNVDLKEAFNIGDDPYDPEQNVPSNFDISSYPKNGNQWPTALPEFRTLMYKYNTAVLSFSKKLMRIIALALDLPETYFDHMAASQNEPLAHFAERMMASKVLSEYQPSYVCFFFLGTGVVF